jgi:hypothetical protein
LADRAESSECLFKIRNTVGQEANPPLSLRMNLIGDSALILFTTHGGSVSWPAVPGPQNVSSVSVTRLARSVPSQDMLYTFY